MGEYRKDGVTNLDFLMYDGDFFVPIIRIDLLEKHDLPLPNTWEEVVTYAKFFNGTDLNDDGDDYDFGFCHFPRVGAGFMDWWSAEAMYSTWATYHQTKGISEGFFFDVDTMEPNIGEAFRRSVEIWRDLWKHGGDGCNSNFIEGRCAIGFAPPGCWKGIFLSPDGVSRKDSQGKVVWRPTMKSGDYAEPYRFKPFGSTIVYDKTTKRMTPCTNDLCPKAERIPPRGHFNDNDRASILKPSPVSGQLINRAPFYWSGGLGCLIRKSSSESKKDMLWDFFVYTNSPDTSVFDVANYASWLDSWRYSQLTPGTNFLEAGWSLEAFQEDANVMLWALSNDVNGALNLRIPGLVKYTRDAVGVRMKSFIDGSIDLDELVQQVYQEWQRINDQKGKLHQLEIYRAALGLDAQSEVELCRLHRDLMDERDPSVCRKYDPASTKILLVSTLVPSFLVLLGLLILFVVEKKRQHFRGVWKIKLEDLNFGEPPEILGRGTFGLVVLAEYRGTQVAVKRVIPPKSDSPSNLYEPTGDFVEASKVDRFFDADVEQATGTGSLKVKGSLSQSLSRNSFCQISTRNLTDGASQSLSLSQSNKTWSRWFTSITYGDDHQRLKADFVKEMQILANLRHPCITTVMGAVLSTTVEPLLVMELMENGSLYDLLHNETVHIEGELILPIMRDIASGLRFLHATDPKVIHGDLKAANVLVDGRFRAKVADFGLASKRILCATGTPYWMAPELLTGEGTNSTASDVYSFGITLYEIFSRQDPYEGEDKVGILKKIADPEIKKRPPVPEVCPQPVAEMMKDCLASNPDLRPTFEELDMRIRRLDTENLESVEAMKSFQRKDKAARNEDLMYKVFPRHVADALRDGRQVEPEKRENVTVFFSDIVGFTDFSSTTSAEKVTDMLDRLYLCFDDLAEKYDIFKIDTIGDAYMCCANLVKDQDDHARRIALFSIDAIKIANQTLLDADDESKGCVNIRVGFHSGPVVARVVGSRTPKYSVFGDTVNTASRMESSSLPGKIQCSDVAANFLAEQEDGTIRLISRGKRAIKGKGEMETFFVGKMVPNQE